MEQKEAKGDAKKASLLGKVVGASEIMLGSVALIILAVTHKITVVEARELFSLVLYCGFSVMAVFGTVDINLMLDKFLHKGD